MIKGLSATSKHENIREDMNALGHEVASITPIVKKSMNKSGERTIKTFSLFCVDLVQKENNKAIFDIKELTDRKITIEPPKKNNSIPQCTSNSL